MDYRIERERMLKGMGYDVRPKKEKKRIRQEIKKRYSIRLDIPDEDFERKDYIGGLTSGGKRSKEYWKSVKESYGY